MLMKWNIPPPHNGTVIVNEVKHPPPYNSTVIVNEVKHPPQTTVILKCGRVREGQHSNANSCILIKAMIKQGSEE